MLKRLSLFTLFAIFAACGARTPLLIDDQVDVPDAAPDVTPPRDGGHDAARDAGQDAPPLIDAFRPDVAPPNDCVDAGATLIYVLSHTNELFSFSPTTATFKRIGNLVCPTAANPWSMAVSRSGIAYSVYDDGNLFRVSTATAACAATAWKPGPQGFLTFGMSFVSDTSGPGETLFVSESSHAHDSLGLGSIDTKTFAFHFVGPFTPAIPRAELTGTGDGRVFAFYPSTQPQGSFISEIDKSTGRIIGTDPLKVGGSNMAWAFAFWGGDFYTFTFITPGPTLVTRFRPSDRSETQVATLDSEIVGAGVSTCAPQ